MRDSTKENQNQNMKITFGICNAIFKQGLSKTNYVLISFSIFALFFKLVAQLRAWVNARYSTTGYHITNFRGACYSFPLYRGLDDKLTLSVSCFCLNTACTVARDLLWVISLFEVVFKFFSFQINFTINFVSFQCNAVIPLAGEFQLTLFKAGGRLCPPHYCLPTQIWKPTYTNEKVIKGHP